METLPTSSARRRSSSCRPVSLSPDPPASGEVLTPIVIASAGSSTASRGSASGCVERRDRLADRHLRKARDDDDLAGSGGLDLGALEPLGHVELRDASALDAAVATAPGDLRAAPDGSAVNAADGEPAVVGGGVEVRHQSLQGRLGVAARRRDPLEQRGEERREVLAARLGVERRPPLSGGGVDDRELDLLLVGVQVEEERVDGVDDLAEPERRAGPPC